MPLFKTIESVKKYIPVANANGPNGLPKSMRIAETEYLLPLLGKELLQALQVQVDTPNEEAADLTKELLEKVLMALAYLMYYKELPFLHTIISDAGIRTITTDKIAGAYRYQYNDLLQACENEGLAGLERVFDFLFENSDNELFASWQDSEAYKRMSGNLINTGKEFTMLYNLQYPHRTFYALQPVMNEVEDMFIIPAVGREFFESLAILNNPTDKEQYVLKCLRSSIANFTIHKAATKLSIKVRTEGVTVMLGSADAVPQNEATASIAQLQVLKEDTAHDGNSYLTKAVAFLLSNASPDIFPLFYNSDLYKDPAVKKRDVNDTMNGIYVM